MLVSAPFGRSVWTIDKFFGKNCFFSHILNCVNDNFIVFRSEYLLTSHERYVWNIDEPVRRFPLHKTAAFPCTNSLLGFFYGITARILIAYH